MAQYFEDFRGETIDSIPADFSVVWEGPLSLFIKTGNPLSGSARHLAITPTSNGGFRRTAVKWGVGTTSGRTTVRFLAKYYPTNKSIVGAFLSGSGESATRKGYAQWLDTDNRISKYSGGSDTAIASGSNPVSGTGTPTIYFEIIRDGALIETRAWDILDQRPATADVAVTDGSPLPVDGFFGISYLTNTMPVMEVYEIAVGTDGSPAPTGPVAAGPVTPINLSVTNLLATSARLNWEQG